jgi:hypothetical protein
MIFALIVLLALQSTPEKDAVSDARAQDYLSGIDGEMMDAADEYPLLAKYIDACVKDLDKLEGEQVADPSYRKDFNKLHDDLISLHFAEQNDHAI